jgi:hypothetical protein
VSGPLRTERARTLLDYHGVGGEPAGTVAQVAARHAVSGRTLSYWVAALRAAGSRLPLSAELITQMTRRSAEGEDHLGRVRTSKTFGVPSPARPSPPHPSRVGQVPADRPAAAIACRMLAAAGPQPLTILRTAVLSGPPVSGQEAADRPAAHRRVGKRLTISEDPAIERTKPMGLIRGIARTAAIAGTATAVSNRVSRRQAGRWAAKDQQADTEQQAQYAQKPPPQYAQQPPSQYAPPQYPNRSTQTAVPPHRRWRRPPRRPPTTCSSNCRSSAN